MLDVAEETGQINTVQYANVAALAFLAWEACITIGDEITHIWSRPRTCVNKWVFLLLRWYTLIALFLTQTGQHRLGVCERLGICLPPNCLPWYHFQTSSLQIVIALQQYIMSARVYALYGNSKRLGIALGVVFILEHAIITTFTILTGRFITFNKLCIAVTGPRTAIGVGLPPLCFDLALLVLTVCKIVPGRRGWRHVPVLRLLLRDNSWAFIVVFGVFCLDGVFFLAVDGPVGAAVWTWQFAVASFSSCRIVLHMYSDAPSSPRSTENVSSDPRPGPGEISEIERDNFALTTFVPGEEFEDDDPSEAWMLRNRTAHDSPVTPVSAYTESTLYP